MVSRTAHATGPAGADRGSRRAGLRARLALPVLAGALLPWGAAAHPIAQPAPAAPATAAVLVTSVELPRPNPLRGSGGGTGGEAVASIADVPVPRPHPGRAGEAAPAAVASTAAPAAATPAAEPESGGGAGFGQIFSLFSTSSAPTERAAAALPNGPAAPAAPVPRGGAGTRTAAVSPAAVPRLAAPAAGDPFAPHGKVSGSFRQALDALRADRYEETFRRRNGLSDPLEREILDWLLVRSGSPKVSYAMVADFARRSDGWPSPRHIRARLEAALSRESPDADTVIRAFGNTTPQTVVGARLLARAWLEKGDRGRAAAIIRPVWHGEAMGDGLQAAIARDFSAVLTVEDHRRRADMLLYRDRASDAAAMKAYLPAADDAYVNARIAVLKRAGNASALLKRVPAEARRRPGYLFGQIAHARRNDDWDTAARLLERAPKSGPDLVDPDEWWTERRIVSRALIERGEARRAYAIAAAHAAESPAAQADAEFHAGWYALSFLKDPGKARRHFQRLAGIGTTPITVSRAEYWLGRAAEAAGNGGAASGHYRAAAAHGTAYYGQLARRELGWNSTGVGTVRPGPGDRAAFARNPQVKAIRKLVAAGHQHRVWPLFDHLSETMPTAGQIVLLADLAEEIGKTHIAVLVGKEGLRRGLDVGRAAFPTDAIPRSASVPTGLDRAVVYAIARQESTFNTGAISPAGARGLMQLMPGTAKAVSRRMGLGYSASRLLTDPSYNVTLGSSYLSGRIEDFGGSYVLAFAAYNAGASRSRQWIERYGDPRGGRLDVVDWVEMIPFTETRNYVQRVMENVQVYREILGTGPFAIEGDLKRGRPG